MRVSVRMFVCVYVCRSRSNAVPTSHWVSPSVSLLVTYRTLFPFLDLLGLSLSLSSLSLSVSIRSLALSLLADLSLPPLSPLSYPLHSAITAMNACVCNL